MTPSLPKPTCDAAAWAKSLCIEPYSVELYLDADVIDLHNDLYVPARLFGYKPHREHGLGLHQGYYFGHTDFPRLRRSGIGGVVFDIATNPARRARRRGPVALRNIERIKKDIAQHPDDLALVTNGREYKAARAQGKMACFIGIQGGQAFQYDRDALESIPPEVHRITLVHLTNSLIGSTSSPLGRDYGALFERGRELVEVMNVKRCLVDLAHINPAGFWSALDVHAKDLPVACTHTGVDGVHEHWRNLDDRQLRAVADTGGIVGVIFHGGFLDGSLFRCQPDKVVDHLEHIIAVAGEDCAAIGTDYDGMIVPPYRLEDVTKLPVLVQLMRDRNWSESQIRKVLGANAQRLFDAIRP